MIRQNQRCISAVWLKSLFLPLLVFNLLTSALFAAVSPVALRCEHRADPLGIDAPQPRLSWQIKSDDTNILQTACQVVVASSPAMAAAGTGDVWDSRRIASSRSLVVYDGAALEPARRYYWSVKIWDNQGHVSSWAKPAWWEMGLLNASDWSGAQWITGADSPAAPLLRTVLNVTKPIAKARLYVGAAGYYVASLNGQRVGDAVLDPGLTAYDKRVLYSTHDVTDSIRSGTNVLGVVLGRGFYAIETVAGKILWWNAAPWLAKQPLLMVKLDITYADQTHAIVVSDPDWLTRPGPTTSNSLYRGETYDARLLPVGWDTANYDARDWAKVWVAVKPQVLVKKALYGVLDNPARTRDVTAEVQRIVGDAQTLPVDKITALGDPAPGVVKTLCVEYSVHGQSLVASAKDFGTVNFEQPNLPNNTIIKKAVGGAPSKAQMAEPIRVVNQLKAVSISQPKPGTYVFKFPVMTAGWPKLKVSGPAGTTVILRCGEKLNRDGTVNNLGDPGLTPGEVQRYEYTLAGQGTEVWEPQFSYAGFQYVQVSQFPGTPDTNSVIACEVHSDVPPTGSFSCSSALLNNVHAMCKQAVLNNLHSIFTDSPMYEKRGWGDDGVLCAHAADNFGMLNFYEKWLNDIGDTQNGQGNISDIAPSVGGDYNDPSWSSYFVVLPWRLYQEYGDVRSMSAHYAAMKRYLEYLASRATKHLLKGFYGDWVSPGFVSPPEGPDLVASANYYRDVLWFSKMADILGYSADAAGYRDLAEKIKQSFNEKYLDCSTGVYRTDKNVGYRQTSNALPLDYGMVPANMVALVVSNLAADVRQRGNHLNTGSFGTAALLPALSENGEAQLAYEIVSQSNYPSWGGWLARGATTTWEQWITGPGLRSRDHAFLGTVDDWFYKYLGGIQPAEPGYKLIRLRPCFPAGLSWVSAAIDTPQGRVSVDWKRTGSDAVEIAVGIPPNTTAELWLPGESSRRLLGSGRHAIVFKSMLLRN